MKSCGTILRILAVVAAVLLCVFTLMDYSLYAKEYKDQYEELVENREDHEESHKRGGMYEDESQSDCSMCENYEDQEDSLDRNKKNLLYGTARNILLYSVVWCGVLFALGEIASKVARSKEDAPAVIPAPMPAPMPVPAPAPTPTPAPAPVAVSPFCPQCGAPKQPGSRFCSICGSCVE